MGDINPYSTAANRSEAIAGFLKKAQQELNVLGVFIAADVFGDTAFVNGDSGIGQHIEIIAPFLDYIFPMVYIKKNISITPVILIIELNN